MHKKDYLQKQLEEFGKVLALIIGFKKNRDWRLFEKQLEEISLQFTGLRLENIVGLENSKFEKEIILNTTISLDHKKIIADLLFEKLEQFLLQDNNKELEKLKQKCLALFEHINNNLTSNEFDLNAHYKLNALHKMDE